jgi:Tol biopolymer transport system component
MRDNTPGEIYSMHPDGSNQTRLTNNSAYDDLPVWSPDMTKIAFVSGRDGDGEFLS